MWNIHNYTFQNIASFLIRWIPLKQLKDSSVSQKPTNNKAKLKAEITEF